MKIRITPPLAGLSESSTGDEQPPLTTREFTNVRPFDAVTGIERIAQRPGLSNYCPTQIDTSAPIVRACAVTFDDRKVTYSDAAPTTNWSHGAPSRKDAVNVRSNFKGDRYVLHDKASVVKLNSAGEEVEKVTLPIDDKDHSCRALAVDALDNFYVGISAGGDQAKAKIVKYRHDPDGSVVMDWEVVTDRYVEDMVIDSKTGFLVTCQNDAKRWKGWITVYQNIQTAVPNVAWEKPTGYPVNAVTVNTAGEVIAVHEPNANRGLDPEDLTLSPKTVDWTVADLAGVGDRLHALVDARFTDSVQKDVGAAGFPVYDKVEDDGDSVAYLRDLSGYNRDLFQVATTAARPTYRKKGFTGGPTISFDGVDDYMKSGVAPNLKEASKDVTKQWLPGWIYAANKGCGFLVWMVVKPTISGTKGCLLGRANVANNVRIWANSDNAGAATAGQIWGQTPSATAISTAPSYDNVNSAAVILLIVDGANDGTQNTTMIVNGAYSNRFSAVSPGERNEDVAATFLGAAPGLTAYAGFELAQMGVLRSSTKTAAGATTEVIQEDGLLTSDTELNRLVGALHHEFGLQHLLPGTHLYKTYPPSRSTGVNYPSVAGLLNNRNAFMAKWAPGGQLRWAFPTAINLGAGTNDLTGSAIGYGVVVTENDIIYTVGPKFSAASTDNERAVIKSWTDNGDSVSIRWSVKLDGAAPGAPGADQSYHWPRLATDEFENLYAPLALTGGDATLAATVQVYSKSPTATLLYTYSTTGVYATNQAGRAVSPNPLVPDYDPDPVTRAPSFVVATTNNGTGSLATIWNVDAIALTFESGPPRDTHNLAVCNGSVWRFDTAGATIVTGGTSIFDPASEYVEMLPAYGMCFMTDGRAYYYYDTKTEEVLPWVSRTSGEIPPRQRLLALFGARAVLGRGPDDATNWTTSAKGDLFAWDKSPPVKDTTEAQGGNASATGRPPFALTALIPISDDLMLIGTERAVYRMTGDPGLGASIDLITDIAGIAFGHAWAKDDHGNVYFFGSSGGVFRVTSGFRVDRISQSYGKSRMGDIDQRLLGINLAQYRVEMIWNFQDDALHVYLVPWIGGQTAKEHYVWHSRTQGWAVDTFSDSSLSPTAVMVTEESDPASRVLLVASGGYMRRWDKDAKDDVGFAIESAVLIGPFAPRSADSETRYTALSVDMAPEHDGCSFEAYVSDGLALQGPPIANGELVRGRNPTIRRLGRGARFWLRLFSSAPDSRWAFDAGVVDAHEGGRRRVRS